MIMSTGPISLADYMTLCLYDPDQGYYTAMRPIGACGDFITAPEVSQLFGELVGIWLLANWQQSGCPAPFHVVELGPGRGTLMKDIVRVMSSAPKAKDRLHVHLVEINPALRDEQDKALGEATVAIRWHDTIETLPKEPLFIIANEFFDCFPIHQWVAKDGKWHERVIGLDQEENLAFGLGPVRAIINPDQPIKEGSIHEVSPAADAVFSIIASHLAEFGGAGLFIDYGYSQPDLGDTLQAIHHHAHANPLHHPGLQDLTSHVNFANLHMIAMSELEAKEACNLTAAPLVTQGAFLLAMGLLERAGQLGRGETQARQESIATDVERLAAPDQMGTLFKCLAIMPKGSNLPPMTLE